MNEQRAAPGSRKRIWWSLVGGVLVWSLHLLVVYALSSLACERNILMEEIAGVLALHLVQTAATVAAAVVVAALGLLALLEWRRNRQAESDILVAAEHKSSALMAFVALLLNMLFLLSFVLSLVPALMLEAC